KIHETQIDGPHFFLADEGQNFFGCHRGRTSLKRGRRLANGWHRAVQALRVPRPAPMPVGGTPEAGPIGVVIASGRRVPRADLKCGLPVPNRKKKSAPPRFLSYTSDDVASIRASCQPGSSMQNTSWIALLRLIPASLHNQLALTTTIGIDIAIQ